MESTIYTVDGKQFELQHYGVKGMKWGKRKAARYEAKARTARESAREWDEMAGYAESRGNVKKAAKYRAYAAQDRAEAAALRNKAKQKGATGKKSVKKSMSKVGKSTVKAAAKTASIGSQMILRMMQNQVTYTTAGRVFDDIYNR